MDVKDFWYDLPQELIAQDPLEDRASSRLLVLDKETGEISHKHFYDIIEYLFVIRGQVNIGKFYCLQTAYSNLSQTTLYVFQKE